MTKISSLFSTLSLVILALTACAGDQEFTPAVEAPPKKALDFSGTRPKEITVKAEETVYGIAYEYGISTRALVVLNDIPSPYELRAGQVLQLPQPNEHVVSPGETLQDVALLYGVNLDALARENEITTTATLSPKQRLRIPPADTDPIVAPSSPIIATDSLAPLPLASKPLDKPQTIAQPKQALPDDLAKELAMEHGRQKEDDKAAALSAATIATPVAKAVTAPKSVAETPKVVETPKEVKAEPQKVEAAAPAVDFTWPVQGKVVSQFGSKAGQAKNDGINIQVPEGTTVAAAQGGEVIYAGNELKGFGNLVLVKHKNGVKTAYAHLKEILVKKGDILKQGKPLGKVGKTGDVSTPQLHFEIREGTKAIDPLTKLGG